MISAYDWASTPLGPIDDWPQSLKTAVGILLHSPVPIVMLWGVDGIMIYNDAYSVFAGGRHPRLLGPKVREGWPEVADFNDNVMRVCLSGGTLAYKDQELTLYRTGFPEQVRMNLDYSPVFDEAGQPAGVIAIVIETTERVAAERRQQAAEAALRAERDRVRGVLDGMTEGFALLDRDFRILDINAEGLRLETRPREAIVGRTHWEAFPGSEDSELGRLYKRAMAERVPVALEHRYVWDDGHEAWLDMRAYVVEQGLAIFYRDVTARKAADAALRKSEAHLAAVFEQATAGFCETDFTGRFVVANARYCEIVGRSREELLSLCMQDITHPDDLSANLVQFAQLAQQGEPFQIEKRYVRPDGSVATPSACCAARTDSRTMLSP